MWRKQFPHCKCLPVLLRQAALHMIPGPVPKRGMWDILQTFFEGDDSEDGGSVMIIWFTCKAWDFLRCLAFLTSFKPQEALCMRPFFWGTFLLNIKRTSGPWSFDRFAALWRRFAESWCQVASTAHAVAKIFSTEADGYESVSSEPCKVAVGEVGEFWWIGVAFEGAFDLIDPRTWLSLGLKGNQRFRRWLSALRGLIQTLMLSVRRLQISMFFSAITPHHTQSQRCSACLCCAVLDRSDLHRPCP